jgi:hypothetical protein
MSKEVLYLGTKWLEHETNHSLPSSGHVKIEWHSTSTHLHIISMYKANLASAISTKRPFGIQVADDVTQNTVALSSALPNIMQLAAQ